MPAVVAAGPARVAALRGIVTGVYPGLGGFFLEAPRAQWGTTGAGAGLFVYTGHRPLGLAPGADVVLSGRFQRFHGMPEIARPHVVARCGSASLPPAVALKLPLTGSGGWTRLLGMRVRFLQPLVVTDLHDFGRYGEVGAAAGVRPLAPTQLTAPGPAAVALAQHDRALAVWLDDGSTHAHPWPLELAGRRFDAAHPLRAGQSLQHVTGIAFHAFGRDLVEPTDIAFDADANPRPSAGGPRLPAGIRIVTFNVENYFNHALTGPPFPTERGARNPSAFQCQTQKLVAALAALHPAVAALQEIENDGYARTGAVAGLTAALNAFLPGADYRYVRPGAPRLGGDLIAPALLYDARVVRLEGAAAVLAAHGRGALAAGLKRPALAADFRPRRGGGPFTVAVVHLRSKLTSCGRALDGYAGAGHCAAARAAAAAALVRWLRRDPTGVGAPARFLVGDFNAYPKEAAIARLTGGGLRDLLAARAANPGRSYTESHGETAGELDYAFANAAGAALVHTAAVWHIDADEAPVFGYAGRPDCTGANAPYRASDHDPLVVVLRLSPPTGG